MLRIQIKLGWGGVRVIFFRSSPGDNTAARVNNPQDWQPARWGRAALPESCGELYRALQRSGRGKSYNCVVSRRQPGKFRVFEGLCSESSWISNWAYTHFEYQNQEVRVNQRLKGVFLMKQSLLATCLSRGKCFALPWKDKVP